MKEQIRTILERYNSGELTLEEANEELKAVGASFHLEPREGDGSWTEEEMREGFVDPAEIGHTPAPTLIPRPDMSRRLDLAGKSVVQTTKIGVFSVEYDELGYAVKASRT